MKRKPRKDPPTMIQRNYLMQIAKETLQMSNAQIASAFNCSRQAVFSILKK